MLIVDALAGIAFGIMLMVSVRNLQFGIFMVPLSVLIGPLLLAFWGNRPSKAFLALYIVTACLLFTVMAVMSPGWSRHFDAP